MHQWAEKERVRADRPRSLPSDAPMAEAVRSVQAAVEREHTSPIDLDGAMRERMESHFGPGVSRVRLVQSDLPGQLGARAVAQGDLIRFAPGAFQPGTEAGARLLSHELGHVVQQSRGGAMGGAAGLPLYDSGAEAGANAIASRAMGGGLSGGLGSFSPAPAAQAPMQGDGFFARIKKWFADRRAAKEAAEEEKRQNEAQRQRAEAEAHAKQLERMYATRAWKIDPAALAQNAENPTGNAELQKELDTLGPQNGPQAKNLSGLFNAFQGMMTSGKLSGELPAGSDTKGVRERLGIMTRMVGDFSILRRWIGGFGAIKPDKGAVMSASSPAKVLLPNIINWNPAKSSNEAPTEPAEAMKKELDDTVRFNAADSRFDGAHELGHVLTDALIKLGREEKDWSKDRKNSQTINIILNKAIRKLSEKEKKKLKNDPNADHRFSDFLLIQAQNGNVKNGMVDFGGSRDSQENAYDPYKNAEDKLLLNQAIKDTRVNERGFSVDPGTGTKQMSKADAAKMDLYYMGQLSRYGAVTPDEAFAELMADVYAHGKNASDLAKEVYKFTWRTFNKDAAQLEIQKRNARRGAAQANQQNPPAPAGQP